MKPHIHIGESTIIREVLPYLKLIFCEDPDSAREIALDFNLDENLVNYLKSH
jgi:hypothetical protein